MKRASVVYVEFEDGTAIVARGEHAAEVWKYIEGAQVMDAVHGGQYRGRPMESIAALDLQERVA